MKAATSFVQVFIHKEPVDMRRGINGLCDIIQASEMGELMDKNLFVFCGKRKNSIKVLYFDRSGFCLWQKRLDDERFKWPTRHDESVVHLSPQQFEWLLEGYDVWKMKPFGAKNFERVS